MQHHYPFRLNVRPAVDCRAQNDCYGDDVGGSRPEWHLPEAHDRCPSPVVEPDWGIVSANGNDLQGWKSRRTAPRAQPEATLIYAIDCGARIGKAAWLWGIGLQGNGLRDNRAQRHDLLCVESR